MSDQTTLLVRNQNTLLDHIRAKSATPAIMFFGVAILTTLWGSGVFASIAYGVLGWFLAKAKSFL